MLNVNKWYMLNRDKLINISIVVGVVSAFILLALMAGLAIKFFFRGLLAMMNHPLEALCFVGLLTILWSAAVWVSEK